MSKFDKTRKAIVANKLVYISDVDMFVLAYSNAISDKRVYVGDLETRAIYLEITADDLEDLHLEFYDGDE